MSFSVERIAIIGMGLIGGSLGLAIKAARGSEIKVIGMDTNEITLMKARQCGAADEVTSDFVAGVVDADIVFICTPVLQVVPIVKTIVPHLKAGAVITDTGSTKSYLLDKISEVLPEYIHYVPGHPMAGREKSGIEAADSNLFKDKWFILTPPAHTSPEAIKTVCRVVGWTGAKRTVMDAAQHDKSTALISHLPHVAAAAMVNLLVFADDEDAAIKLAGGGFRDTTRIASSNADMWSDICMTNAGPIADSLEKFSQMISKVAEDVRAGKREKIHEFFEEAKFRRDKLLELEAAITGQPLSNGR